MNINLLIALPEWNEGRRLIPEGLIEGYEGYFGYFLEFIEDLQDD